MEIDCAMNSVVFTGTAHHDLPPASARRKKERMVSFRMSEDEYLRFKELCSSFGGRTISEMARSLLQQWIQDGTTDPSGLLSRLQALEGRMDELNRQMMLVSSSSEYID